MKYMPKQENKLLDILAWIVQIVIALLLVMPVVNKFLATEAAVEIFNQIGGGDSALYGTAITEALVIIMLLVPVTRLVGLFCAAFVMLSAIICHMTYIGIEVLDDGGTMFAMACAIFGLSVFGMLLRGKEYMDFYQIAMGYKDPVASAADAH